MAGLLLAAIAAPARADSGQGVAAVTVYGGAGHGVSTHTVTLGQLAGCPLYGGSSPFYLYSGSPPQPQPFTPAQGSSWELATVLSCGLRLPAGNISSVQIQQGPPQGFENPLSASELSDPSRFGDPAAPTALPLLSVDGNQNQTTYVRPWRGGNDDNANDEVIESGTPVSLVVFEHGAALSITATKRELARTGSALKLQFSATARTANGASVSPSQLTWSWNFADGHTSTSSRPDHSFTAGTYPVTLQVSDPQAGTGGTATINTNFNPTGKTGGQHKTGAGARHRGTPSGPEHSSGAHPGSSPGSTGGSAQVTDTTTTPGAASAPTDTATTTPSAPAGHGPQTGTPRNPHRAHDNPSTRLRTAAGPLVSGELISDVSPLPASALPTVPPATTQLASAPAVRGSAPPSPLGVIAGLSAVALLLGLGAVRELSGIGRLPRLPWPSA